MARPDRPVLAVVGDGASLYQIMSLWTAVRYGVGIVVLVLANGGYAIMDRLAEHSGGTGPWPRLDGIDIAGLARAQGVEAERVDTHEALVARLDALVPGSAARRSPVLLEIVVEPDPSFDP
jgi:benzoylformate decarboxylase